MTQFPIRETHYDRPSSDPQKVRIAELVSNAVESEELDDDIRGVLYQQEDSDALCRFNSEMHIHSRCLARVFVNDLADRNMLTNRAQMIEEVLFLTSQGKQLPPRLTLFVHNVLAQYLEGQDVRELLGDSRTPKQRNDAYRNVQIAADVMFCRVVSNQSLDHAFESVGSSGFGIGSEACKKVWTKPENQAAGYSLFLATFMSELTLEQIELAAKLVEHKEWFKNTYTHRELSKVETT